MSGRGIGAIWRIALYVAPVVIIAVSVRVLFDKPDLPPINTEADARPVLEQLLRDEVRSAPNLMIITDLARQITNVRVQSATQITEPPNSRFVLFSLDTGCGEVIEAHAFLRSSMGNKVTPASRDNCS